MRPSPKSLHQSRFPSNVSPCDNILSSQTTSPHHPLRLHEAWWLLFSHEPYPVSLLQLQTSVSPSAWIQLNTEHSESCFCCACDNVHPRGTENMDRGTQSQLHKQKSETEDREHAGDASGEVVGGDIKRTFNQEPPQSLPFLNSSSMASSLVS